MTTWPRSLLMAALTVAGGAILVGVRDRTPSFSAYGSEAPVVLVPTLSGEPEYCLTCHDGIEEISSAHPMDAFGCVLCHGGQPLALEAETAHAGMRGGRNPSDVAVVEASCGGAECHSGPAEEGLDHIHRSEVSLQSTYAGPIAAVRRAFGSQTDRIAHYAVVSVQDPQITTATGLPFLEGFFPVAASEPSPVSRLSERCLTCHVGGEPIDRPGFQRLTGCASCHAISNWEGTYTGGDPTIARDESGHAASHRLTTVIPYTQCDTCHNRGNYSLVDMTFHERTDLPADGSASRLEAYYQPIARFTACEYQLDCIDCHPSSEVMGDGDLHSQMSEVRTLECRTCHGTLTEGPLTRIVANPDDPLLRQARLNPHADLEAGDTVLVTRAGAPLWNTQQLPDGSFTLMAKASGETSSIPQVAGSACEQDPGEQASSACHECHAVERP